MKKTQKKVTPNYFQFQSIDPRRGRSLNRCGEGKRRRELDDDGHLRGMNPDTMRRVIAIAIATSIPPKIKDESSKLIASVR